MESLKRHEEVARNIDQSNFLASRNDRSIDSGPPESKLSAFNGVIVTFETERGNISFEKFDDSRNNLNKKKKDRSIFCTIIQHLTKDDD